MESMIKERITPRDQKIIDEITSDSLVVVNTPEKALPSSFIQEMVHFSKSMSSHQNSQPSPPPKPLQEDQGSVKILTPTPSVNGSDDSSSSKKSGSTKVTIPRIPLPLPENYYEKFMSKNRDGGGTKKRHYSFPPSPMSETVWNPEDEDFIRNDGENFYLSPNPPRMHQETQPSLQKQQCVFENRIIFMEEDLTLFQKVISKRLKTFSGDDVLRIICRTGKFKENGFPCHGCLKILLSDDIDPTNDVTFSFASGGRCDECIKFKTREEWDAISWQRLEWYTQTPDGKLAGSVFKSLVVPLDRSTTTTSATTSSASTRKFVSSSQNSAIANKIADRVADEIVKELTFEKLSDLVTEKIAERLERFNW